MNHLINKNYFDIFQNTLQAINPGCDMLVINLQKGINGIETHLKKLDYDNSEMATFQSSALDYTINKSENGEFVFGDISISVDDTSYKIMRYSAYKSKIKRDLFKMYGQLTFYSTLFRIIELDTIPYKTIYELLEDTFPNDYKSILKSDISRYDYKLDFILKEKMSLPKREDIINDTYQRRNEEFYRLFGKGNIENTGWIVGSKSNKSYVIRLYEKNIDTKVKNKWHLYGDYLEYPSVFRLEGEFHTKFNKKMGTSYSLLEIDQLEMKARKFFLLENDGIIEKFLHQYRTKELDIKNITKNIPYIKTTLSRLARIAERGVNPFILFATEAKTTIETKRKIPTWSKELNIYVKNVLLHNQGQEGLENQK